MSETSNAHFFSELPIHQVMLSQLLGNEERFVAVPAGWHVVVTDIKNSSAALAQGRNEEVNLIAAGSVIAALNLAYRANILVPFFFGGDGATLIVPHALLSPVIRVLNIHRENTRQSFGLDLRVGCVSVADLYAARYELKISRLWVSDGFSIPVLLGHGLFEAERRIKERDPAASEEPTPSAALDLDGMECRWDRVKPDVPAQEVVSLLVTAREDLLQAPVFKRVLDLIDEVYGSLEARNPVSVSQLRLAGRPGKIALEMRAKLGRFSLSYLVRNWLLTQLGRIFFLEREAGRHYVERLVTMTDTLAMDGRINTVIAGTTEQRRRLEAGLEEMEREGVILYGLCVSKESVMSCYVRDRADQHIHFVDGSEGGYTMAASMWKRKRLERGSEASATSRSPEPP